MNYYEEIKENLTKCEIYDKARDYAKDRNKVNVYFEIGRLLSDAGKEYGKNIIKQYSEKLMIEVCFAGNVVKNIMKEILDICVDFMKYLKMKFGTWRVPN